MTNTRIYKKRRNDRTHIIYQLTCEDTGQTYIGITAARFPNKLMTSLQYRWVQHCYKAMKDIYTWPLHEALRQYDNWSYEILETVVGKDKVHIRERELINLAKPKLNRI